MDPVNFVLTDFSSMEKQAAEEAILKVGEAVPSVPEVGLAAAMNKYNQRESPSP